jgi:hypothetical protein
VTLVNVRLPCESKPQLGENDPATRLVNLKACFYQALADAFERDQVEELRDETTIGHSWPDFSMRLIRMAGQTSNPRASARAQGVRSPDRAEALMLPLCTPPQTIDYRSVRHLPRWRPSLGDSDDGDYRPVRRRGRGDASARASNSRAPVTSDNRTSLKRKALAVPVVAIGLLTVLLSHSVCFAEQMAAAPEGMESDEALANQVNDPTSRLTQFQIKGIYTPAQYGTNAQLNTLQIRPIFAIRAFSLMPLEQLIRPTIKVVTVPDGKGASTSPAFDDMQLLDLFVVPWPDTTTPGLKISALLQQATSFAYTSSKSTPVTSLTFQPIISCQLGHGWYLKSSDATWTFNLHHKTSTTIPLSHRSFDNRQLP